MADEKQQIELDLENEVEVELPEQEEEQQEAAPVETAQDDDNFEKAESATQKRIDRLTKKMREAERQREEALKYAQVCRRKRKSSKQRMDTLDTNYVQEYSSRVESQMASAEGELARAMEVGDTNAVVEAQRKITRLAIENDRAEQAKAQQERSAKAAEAQPAAGVSQPSPQQQPRRPDPKAEAWAQKNEWFGSDEAMTYAAFGIHKKLVEDEGFDPKTDDYYTELDRRMGDEFPHKLGNSGGSKRPAQTVASVSRNTSGRSSGKKVRLTP